MALLEIDGLTKRYGGLTAVNDVTMRVQAGEIRAVIGPNGAGKTSLFHLITGVVAATSGQVRFDGRSLTGLSSYHRCQAGLSRTFQLTSLFPEMTARENCRIAAQARLTRRWQPYGGATVFGEASARGDEAMERLGLTAVAARPAGLFSQGLSVEETLTAVETLSGLFAGGRLTVLLVEHDMEVVFRLAQKIMVMHRGSVIADDVPSVVKEDAAVQAAYLGGYA
jgi:branched-chain amino acid transport system ATP-binding protein